VTGQKGIHVYVIDSPNTAEQRSVTVERSSNGLTVIASGLSEGERVVTEGMSRLAQGASVDLGTSRDSTGRGGGGGRGGRGGSGGKAGGKASGSGGQGKT